MNMETKWKNEKGYLMDKMVNYKMNKDFMDKMVNYKMDKMVNYEMVKGP